VVVSDGDGGQGDQAQWGEIIAAVSVCIDVTIDLDQWAAVNSCNWLRLASTRYTRGSAGKAVDKHQCQFTRADHFDRVILFLCL
jgi:hypothetical protein